MRAGKMLFVAVLIVAVAAGLAFAMKHEASVDKGRALFSDPKLGTNGKTCDTCHPGGKGLEKAGIDPGLAMTVNGCITQMINGKALGEKSVEMQSLVMYIKSLGDQSKIH